MPLSQASLAAEPRQTPAGAPLAHRYLGLDVLRSAAILMVLASHWSAHIGFWFNIPVPQAADVLGDEGVELFFALSGFLIGRILIEMVRRRPGWEDFARFALRRALRTMPLYYLWLGLLLCVFPPRQDFAVEAFRYLTLSQNLLAPFPRDYYFAVTWSLTIEVWFYLLFGLAVVLHARRMPGARALACCLTLFMCVPLLLRLFYLERGALVFLRIDEIAYGVAAACLYARGHWLFNHPWASLITGIGLNAVILCGWIPLPGFLTVPLTSNLQVIGCVLCLPAALRLTHGPAWFAQPVRWIASRSYALYIVHLTMLGDVAEKRLFEPGLLPPLACVAVAIISPFLLADISYRWIEAPILRWRPERLAWPRRKLQLAPAGR